MRHALLAGFFLLLTLPARPQPPGYQGKRTLFSASVSAFPNLYRDLYREQPFRLNTRLSLQGEHVFRRNFSAGIALSYLETQNTYLNAGRTGEMGIQTWTASVQFRFYRFLRKGNLAPVGPYRQIEAGFVHYALTDLSGNFYPDGRPRLGSYNDFLLGATLGSQRIFYDRFSFFYALRSAWVFQTFVPTDNARARLKDTATRRLRGFMNLQLQVGVGVLVD